MKQLAIFMCFSIFGLPDAHAQYLISTVAGNGIQADTGIGGPATAASFCNDVEYVSMNQFGQLIVSARTSLRAITPASMFLKIAGTCTASYSPDGIPATAVLFTGAFGTVTDGSGNLYVSDASGQAIRMVSTSGIISTVAGTLGTTGYSGDGGPATAATLNQPIGITIDRYSNLYFADWQNHCVRKMDASGNITTVAGIGSPGFSGDGLAATAAQLQYPVDVSADTAGNLYIADEGNSRIRKVNPSGIISTIAGTTTTGSGGDGGPATAAHLNGPAGITVDRHGNLFIVDLTSRVRMVNTAGIITTVAGTGVAGYSEDNGCSATTAQLNYPQKVCVDTFGNIYIADMRNYRVRKLTPNFKPAFTGGHTQTVTIFKNASVDSLNTALSVNDTNQGQSETWTVVKPPTHGSYGGVYATVCPNGVMTPVSFYYIPATGYIGGDTMRIAVADCGGGTDTTTLYLRIEAHVAAPLPIGTGEALHLYPDPGVGSFTCVLSSPVTEEVGITITNIAGQTIQCLAGATNTKTDIRLDAPPGMYFVTATTANGKWYGRLVIAK